MNLLQACSSTEQLELNARLYNCGHLAFPVAAEMITGADMMKLLEEGMFVAANLR